MSAPSDNTTPLALVIGATGGVGGEVARVLLARGWRVRALNRSPQAAAKAAPGLGVEWVRGDAMDATSVVAAAEGARLIVHGANPPGYRNWGGTVIPMLDSAIAAAKAVGARILFPGTVYNFGPEDFGLIAETAPQRPRTVKGLLRVAMEQRLAEASRQGVKVLIVRAGDFFGPRSGNNWFAQGLVQAGKPVSLIMNPGRRGVGHAWAYLPDLAETMVRLVEQEGRLGDFDVFHFAGHWFERGEDLPLAIQSAVRTASGRKPAIIPFPWPLVTLLSPFVELFREMSEMRYLWRERLQLDNGKLVAFLGAEPHTQVDQAVRASLEGQACQERGSPRQFSGAPPGLQGVSGPTSPA